MKKRPKKVLPSTFAKILFLVAISILFVSGAENLPSSSADGSNFPSAEIDTQTLLLENDGVELATIVNGVSIEDSYIQEYLKQRRFFNETSFSPINEDVSTIMESGNSVAENVRGYIIKGEKYAIHLIICDEEARACYFRINGVPTGKFVPKDSKSKDGIRFFELDGEFGIEIESIKFNDCGDRHFCDIYWDEENIVNISVVKR